MNMSVNMSTRQSLEAAEPEPASIKGSSPPSSELELNTITIPVSSNVVADLNQGVFLEGLGGQGLGLLKGAFAKVVGGLFSGEGRKQGLCTTKKGESCTASTLLRAGGAGPQGVTPGETGPEPSCSAPPPLEPAGRPAGPGMCSATNMVDKAVWILLTSNWYHMQQDLKRSP